MKKTIWNLNATPSTAPQNKVTIIPGRHSRVLLAGFRKKSPDTRLRGHDGQRLGIRFYGAAIRTACLAFALLFLLAPPAQPPSSMAADSPWLAVTGPCSLSFPMDHGPHPGYRVEWWYYTGNLLSEQGDPYGYQLTFFRYQASPPGSEAERPPTPSAWRTSQIYFVHAALSDIRGKRHLHEDLAARSALDLAGAVQEHGVTTITLRNWTAVIGASDHLLSGSIPDFGLNLTLKPAKDVVLHGVNGYSLKGETPGSASCYYSFTRLDTKGELTVDGSKLKVRGESWMDHEFSSAPLEADVAGWDWFGLQLSDTTELMIYFLRKKDGTHTTASGGTFVDASGRTAHLTGDGIGLTVNGRWKSPRSGAVYPAGWSISIPGLNLDLTVTPNIQDQEMATPETTGVTYWEGSVSVDGRGKDGEPVTGSGYVELTGYAGSTGTRF